VSKCTPCVQVSVGAEGSTISGSLQRRKKSKRKWKRLWFLLKDKVLYTFKAREVRGPRVSHTSTDTTLRAHKLSYAYMDTSRSLEYFFKQFYFHRGFSDPYFREQTILGRNEFK